MILKEFFGKPKSKKKLWKDGNSCVTKPSVTKPSTTKPSMTKPSTTKPSVTKPIILNPKIIKSSTNCFLNNSLLNIIYLNDKFANINAKNCATKCNKINTKIFSWSPYNKICICYKKCEINNYKEDKISDLYKI